MDEYGISNWFKNVFSKEKRDFFIRPSVLTWNAFIPSRHASFTDFFKYFITDFFKEIFLSNLITKML